MSTRVVVSATVTREVFARDGLCCRYCGYKHHSATKFHLDHVIPCSAGGLGVPKNLVVACERCNSMKREETWVPMSVASARALRHPLKPFVVLRSQGYSTTEAKDRLGRIRRLQDVPRGRMARQMARSRSRLADGRTSH